MVRMNKSSFECKPFIYLVSVVLALCFCFDTTQETLRNPAYLFALAVLVIVFFTRRGKIDMSDISPIYIILTVGTLIKIFYVLYTAIWTRQHDVIDFGVGEGHAGYIEYIYYNNALPAGDPREKWAFFQPPLHHIISAIWMKVCNKFGLAYRQLQENIQGLTLFYSAGTVFLSYFICKELGLKERGQKAALLLISFHPVFILMSGSINNDALSLFLMIFALYILILWYKRPTCGYILLLALSLGLSMFSKLSGGLLAPAAAFLFLCKLVKEKEKRGSLFLQYVLFGLIVFPLGIGWELRNMKHFGMPFNYIPPVGEQLVKTDLFSRLLDLRLHSVYPAMINNGDSYDEYNVFLAMLKTSLFDDSNFGLKSGLLTPIAVLLFASAVILSLICLYATIVTGKRAVKEFVKRHQPEEGEEADNRPETAPELTLMLAVFYLTMLIAYFSFALGSPNYSAESFRYISPAIIVQAVFLGLYTEDRIGTGTRGERVIYALELIFAASSALLYTLLGCIG